MNQFMTPLADALNRQTIKKYVSFDVPGHKQNHNILSDFFGDRCVELDINSRKSIDYLCEPRGVIREAELLAAEAFGAASAYFMVGGTTSSVQAMVMCACKPGEKIILPRNVHYSVINAVILAGAIPVYIDPAVHPELGISMGMRFEDVEKCIKDNCDAKAIFVNNPTYYGICSAIRDIVKLAHSYGIKVLADEAHGTHFYFNDRLPVAAMYCGADMAAVSMHKTGGSFTQSSILLSADTIDPIYVNNIINLTRTTSGSYLLMSSLDLARSFLATKGKERLDEIIDFANKSRTEINEIGGYYAFAGDIIDGNSVYDFDETKLSVYTPGIGLTGIEVYTLLRREYNIQIEFGDINNILAVSAIGDNEEMHKKLVFALSDISRRCSVEAKKRFSYEYISPTVAMSPREAFYSSRKYISVRECEGKISADCVMYYPPGIPLLAPGELITDEIISHIMYASLKGCSVSGVTEDGNIAVVG